MKIRTILCLPLLLIASALQAEQPQLEALEARATDTTDGLVLSILGRNFDNGNILEVRLAGMEYPLPPVDPGLPQNAEEINVFLPALLQPGTYTVFISTGGGTIRYDEIDFTYGAVGLQGPPGEKGDIGPQGEQGLQGIPGLPGADSTVPGPQGERGLPGLNGADGADGAPGANGTDGAPGADGVDGVPGEQGPQGDVGPPGPPGPPGVVRIYRVVVTPGFVGDEYYGTAACEVGDVLLGGGFYNNNLADSEAGDFIISQNGPRADESWRFVGKDTTGSSDGSFGMRVTAICAELGIGPEPEPDPIPQPALAQSFASAINGLIGDELSLPPPINLVVQTTTFNWTPTLSQFALCQPSDPSAAPGTSPPIYGCESLATVQVFANSAATEVTLTAQVATVFYDFAGNWTTNIPTAPSGSGEGYLLFNNVAFSATAYLIDAGGGLKTVGAVTDSSLEYDGEVFEIDFGNALLNVIASTLEGALGPTIIDNLEIALVQIVEQNALAIPPFALEQ